MRMPLHCASVDTHYRKTTKKTDGRDEICSTGLRVYEGAQVLSCFIWQYGTVLIGPQSKGERSGNAKVNVVELGCGCGLSGFTAARVLKERHVDVIFTDASKECLDLVVSSGDLQGIVVRSQDGCSASQGGGGADNTAAITYCLEWGSTQVGSFIDFLADYYRRPPLIPLLIASDVMYYRVDVEKLMRTICCLLETVESHQDYADRAITVLSHFMRIPNGRQKLRDAAAHLHIGIATVYVSSFLDPSLLRERGWGGLEVVLLFKQRLGDSSDVETMKSIFQDREKVFRVIGDEKSASLCARLSRSIQPYTCPAAESEENFFSLDL